MFEGSDRRIPGLVVFGCGAALFAGVLGRVADERSVRSLFVGGYSARRRKGSYCRTAAASRRDEDQHNEEGRDELLREPPSAGTGCSRERPHDQATTKRKACSKTIPRSFLQRNSLYYGTFACIHGELIFHQCFLQVCYGNKLVNKVKVRTKILG